MNSEVMQTPQLSTGRLLLLGVASVILCLSFIMAIFAPFPLALAIILYGRTKGYLTGLAGLVLAFAFALLVYRDLTLFGFYACILVFGVTIAEIILRGISPIKGLVVFGLIFLSLLFGGTYSAIKSQGMTAEGFIVEKIEESDEWFTKQKEMVEKSSDQEAIQMLQLLDNPKMLARELMGALPSYIFIGTFLMLWFNMFLALKSRRLLHSGQDYPYSEANLLNFKVPFPFVMVLASGLALAVWGSELGSVYYETLGFTIIKCLGIFYFFQGFGVFSDLLTFLGIRGFFRTLIVMLIIFMANYIIAVAGLFDNWFDFRKYFVKRKTQD